MLNAQVQLLVKTIKMFNQTNKGRAFQLQNESPGSQKLRKLVIFQYYPWRANYAKTDSSCHSAVGVTDQVTIIGIVS
jgi:hypothetical protein